MTQGETKRQLTVKRENWPLTAPFRITGHIFTGIEVVVVTLTEAGVTGRGEATGIYYRGDDAANMVRQVEAVRAEIEAGVSRADLQSLMPAGGARNAVDCALWDLEAKQSGTPVWQLAGLEREPQPLVTLHTLGTDTPDKMAAGAQHFAQAKALKLKLVGDGEDAARVRAVRAARPDVTIAVDANQGFTPQTLADLLPTLVDCNIALVEQPFPTDADHLLDGLNLPMPVAADESVQTRAELRSLVGRVQVINIKLDKSGGLTEALAIAREARALGFKVMVGNMMGTSLAMAPLWIVGQYCDFVDMDGPMLLVSDRDPVTQYHQGLVSCAPAVWGWPA